MSAFMFEIPMATKMIFNILHNECFKMSRQHFSVDSDLSLNCS